MYSTIYDKMYIDNIKVFNDTRNLSAKQYKDETKQLKKRGVFIYQDSPSCIDDNSLGLNPAMNISFIHSGTVSAAYKQQTINNDKVVAMLNFADAKRPGGWVIDGAPTQEENMCRCTNLYEALILPECDAKYYKYNDVHHTDAHLDEAYTDALIYCENVLVFKDDETYKRIYPKYVDVITCPAPCGNVANVEDVLVRRMTGIVKSAYLHEVNDIVLGAWGCGAFGQNPVTVAKCFAKVLRMYPVFDNVIFAIRPTVSNDLEGDVFTVFLTAFNEVYYGAEQR